MKKHLAIVTCLGLLFAAAAAQAQEASVTDDPNQSVTSFATMDRGDSTSKLGLNSSMTFLNTDASVTALRLDLHGQFVNKKGYGIYGSLPLSHLSSNMTGNDLSELALGNLEVGGIYNHKISNNLTLTVRAGLSLPTADKGDEDVFVNFYNILPRFTDYVTMFPETTALRTSASLRGSDGQLFYRVDAGLDAVVDQPDAKDFDSLFRLNVGVGINAGSVALMGEFVSLRSTGDESRFTHTAALTAALTSNRQFKPTVSIVVPISDSMKEFFDASVMIGLQGRLP